jgi:hypothetical protein
MKKLDKIKKQLNDVAEEATTIAEIIDYSSTVDVALILFDMMNNIYSVEIDLYNYLKEKKK